MTNDVSYQHRAIIPLDLYRQRRLSLITVHRWQAACGSQRTFFVNSFVHEVLNTGSVYFSCLESCRRPPSESTTKFSVNQHFGAPHSATAKLESLKKKFSRVFEGVSSQNTCQFSAKQKEHDLKKQNMHDACTLK